MEKNSLKQRRQFYLICFVALSAVAAVKYYHGKRTTALVLFTAGVIPLLIEFAIPALSARLFSLWMKFAEILAIINTHLLVTLMYFFILTPVGIARRLTGKRGRYERESRRRHSSWLPIVDTRSLQDRYTSPF